MNLGAFQLGEFQSDFQNSIGSTGVIYIITGAPFSVTFNGGTDTFTIVGENCTSLFNAGAILTVIGGSPNGGYQQVVSSTFSGGNTVVTCSSYASNTVYPGPATFTAGTGTIIWFFAGP
jgi:hypothetical protein